MTALLFLDVIVDPSNKIFHLKYILFTMVFVVWIPSLLSGKPSLPRSMRFPLFFVGLIMPGYALSLGLIKSFVQNIPMGEILYLNSFFFFLLLPVIMLERIHLKKIFNSASLAVVLITGISYLILLYNPNTFGSLYTYLVTDKNVAMYALRNYGGFTLLMLFYKTSSLLVFPLSFYLFTILIEKKRHHLFLNISILVAIIVTLFISGTRANILSLCLIIFFYFLFYVYKKSKPIFFLTGFAFILLFVFVASFLNDTLLNKSEVSNMVKFGHLISYIQHFSTNWGVYIWGQGFGSNFYSSGVNSMVSITELTYLELIRVWGLPLTLVFVAILFLPLYVELKSGRISHLFIAYLAFLFIAGTNPMLLSSTGMLVLVYVFSEMYSSQSFVKK